MRKILIAALVFSPSLLLAQTAKLTLDDILSGPGATYRVRGGEALTSPDGNYTLSPQGGTLTLKSLNGGADKVLATSPGPIIDIHWAPDGKRIAYGSQGQIWVVAVAGGEPGFWNSSGRAQSSQLFQQWRVRVSQAIERAHRPRRAPGATL